MSEQIWKIPKKSTFRKKLELGKKICLSNLKKAVKLFVQWKAYAKFHQMIKTKNFGITVYPQVFGILGKGVKGGKPSLRKCVPQLKMRENVFCEQF